MIEDLGYTGSRLGVYAGEINSFEAYLKPCKRSKLKNPAPGGLAAAFCMAQFSSSMLWGVISDTYGRKVAIVFGTFGAALGMLVFGSAKNYPQAVIGVCSFLRSTLSWVVGCLCGFRTLAEYAIESQYTL